MDVQGFWVTGPIGSECDALAWIRGWTPDLVVLDEQLMGCPSNRLAHELRQRDDKVLGNADLRPDGLYETGKKHLHFARVYEYPRLPGKRDVDVLSDVTCGFVGFGCFLHAHSPACYARCAYKALSRRGELAATSRRVVLGLEPSHEPHVPFPAREGSLMSPNTNELSNKALSTLTFAAYYRLVSGERVTSVICKDGKGHEADPDGVAELEQRGLATPSDTSIVLSDEAAAFVERIVEVLQSEVGR